MSLSLSCTCGARFEVEETFAGQEVACPECHEPIAVPARSRQPVRTSGFAVASVVLSLVGAFTLVLSLLAVVLGGIALVSIRQNRDRIAGAGYAWFGIAAGLVFSGLFLFALLMPELFGDGLLQEGLMGMQADRNGPLEVVRKEDGFAITRPSPRWGVARSQLRKEVSADSMLLLVKGSHSAFIQVERESLFAWTMEQYRDSVAESYRKPSPRMSGSTEPRLRNYSLRYSQRLENRQGKEVHELFFDVHVNNIAMTFLIRLIGPIGDQEAFVLRAWAPRRAFVRCEAEIRQAFDSFRVLDE